MFSELAIGGGHAFDLTRANISHFSINNPPFNWRSNHCCAESQAFPVFRCKNMVSFVLSRSIGAIDLCAEVDKKIS